MKRNLHVRVKPQFCIILLLSILAFNNAFSQPGNDNCGTSTLLTSNTTCTNTNGTVANATNSGIAAAPCTGNANDDVWYRFVAVSMDHTITLSNIGSSLNTSGARLQLFSGVCGSLVHMACGTTSIAVNGLVPGTTYYIRVYSAGGGALTFNAGFRICVTHTILDVGKSYVNLTKPGSGTVETGDILEIRASVVVRAGTYDSCRFIDNIPAGTTYIPNTLVVRTNEGKVYKQFTDGAADDEGWITGSAITMNLGYNTTDNPSTPTRRGRIRNTHKPSFFGGTCIMMATYRVTVTAAIGTIINTGGGGITYSTVTPTVASYTFPSNQVAVYTNYGMCANAIGANSLGTEFNGTFGSGPTRNRGTSANVPPGYTYSFFTNSGPNDYYYGIANNTSTINAYTTSNAWPKPDNSAPTHRTHSVWDIIGDHTGAADPVAGNPATDTVANNNGGYMLIVNAAYRIDSAFQQTISNLCPNTYYEISCWMRNICSKCGCDSNGRGASQSGYIPTDLALGDSSGVTPNVTFEVDGVDYYSTGNISYTGEWVQRGFTYLTGPSQTSFTLKFFNNAPGGGGNDWALDDITVATCLPNMSYSPSLTPNVCEGNALTIYDTVRSYFDNYVYYKWQRSTDGGTNWTDVSAPFGPVPPGPNPNLHHNGTDWEYVSSYTVPPIATLPANSGDKYRVVVASTLTNLSDNDCSSTDVSNAITMTVITCGPVLSANMLSFTGKLSNGKASLQWSTTGENEALYFDIERSSDGINFSTIATLPNDNNYNEQPDSYAYTDPEDVIGKVYYRIKIRTLDNRSSYSKIIQLTTQPERFAFGSVISPFTHTLYFDLSSLKPGRVKTELINHMGQPIRRKNVDVWEGVSQLIFENTGTLAPGVYILKAEMEGQTIYTKVLKQN